MARLKEIFIEGMDPFERGRQHGAQSGNRIANICKGYKESFAKKGYTWEEAKARGEKYLPLLEKEVPDLLTEAKGIAAGAEVELAVILLLNARYELLKFKKGVDYFEDAECTCFGLEPEATANHETIGGQNWDKQEYVGKELYVLHIDEGNGTRIMGLCEPGQLIRSGMNNHGLSLNCSTLLSTKDHRAVSLPTNFMRRRLLQCRTLDEACAILDGFKPSISLNYVLTHKESSEKAMGHAIVYETTPLENYKLYPSRGIVTQGNDLAANPAIERFIPADPYHTVHFRGQRLRQLLQGQWGKLTEVEIEEALKDH